jgi:hypothetical protein
MYVDIISPKEKKNLATAGTFAMVHRGVDQLLFAATCRTDPHPALVPIWIGNCSENDRRLSEPGINVTEL